MTTAVDLGDFRSFENKDNVLAREGEPPHLVQQAKAYKKKKVVSLIHVST